MRFLGTIFFMIVASQLTYATVINIPADYATIQEGINAAGVGDTVLIADDIYSTPLNIDGRSGITIMGQSQAGTIIKPNSVYFWLIPGYPAYDSRRAGIRVVSSTDIVIENLTLDFDLIKGNNVAGVLYWDATGKLTGNLIQNMSVSDLSGGYYEITTYFRSPGYSPASRAHSEITGNTFFRTGRLGITAHDYVDLLIDGNTFDKGGDDFGYSMELGSTATATVTGNIIYGFHTPAASDNSASAGIYVENSFTAGVVGVTKTIHLEGNEIYDCQNGLFIGNQVNNYAGDVDIVLTAVGNHIHDNHQTGVTVVDEDREHGSSVHASFSGNIVTNNGSVGYLIGSNGDADITVDMTDETITGHGIGIGLSDNLGGGSGSIYAITVSQSVITDNAVFGIENEFAGTIIEAANNYWGTYTGPYHPVSNPSGTGNAVSDYVNFIPWCNADFSFCEYPVRCGDANSDDDINVADAVFLINYVFKGGDAPDPRCKGDANGDGDVNIADAVYLINHVFKGGPPPVDGCCP